MASKFEELCVAGFVIVGSLTIFGYFYSILTGPNEIPLQITDEDLVIASKIILLSNPSTDTPKSDSNYDYRLEQLLVVFGYLKDKDFIRVPCIGALIDNSLIISTDSCLEPYRKFELTAIVGFNNDTEAISVGSRQRHFDYVKRNKSEADIIRVKTLKNVEGQSINLENNIDRSLSFYTNGSFQLYRIGVDKNYKPAKQLITADKIKDCGQLIFCLEENLEERDHRVGSFLVAMENDQLTLLGMEQNRTIQNNRVPYTKLPLYVAWLQ